jgi:membrane protein implicated in regulation of membrane protease activity
VPVFRGQDVAGQTGVVVDHVGDAHHAGHVRIGGEQWLAVTEDSGALPPGTEVVVADVQGTTLTVRPVPSASRPTSPTPAPAEG